MTNETDIRECCAQIELIRQLTTQTETFDLNKVLIELETKKKLLTKFKPRTYDTILQGLESGTLVLEETEETASFMAKIKARKAAEAKVLITRLEAEQKAKKEADAEEVKAFELKKEAEEKAKAKKLKAVALKAERIAAKKAELAALETKEVES